MKTRDVVFVILVLMAFFISFIATTIHNENLALENEMLRDQNHMLKTTLKDFGAQIEELSTTIDELKEELNRGNEWNEEAIPKYRR